MEKKNNTVFSNIVTYLHTVFFEFLSLKHNFGIIIRTEYIGDIINVNNNLQNRNKNVVNKKINMYRYIRSR